MGRIRTVAGHFKEVEELQPMTVKQNAQVRDENGNLVFKEDMATPVMRELEQVTMVRVKNIVWVPQQEIEFSQEEEEARDAEEALWEYEKGKPVPLTERQEMDLLLEEGPEAVKAKRAEHAKAMEEYMVGYTALVEVMVEKHNAVVAAKEREAENAVT